MKDRFKFTTAQTKHIEAIVSREEMELAAFHDGRYNPEDFVLISIQNPEDTTDFSAMQAEFKKHIHTRFNDVAEPEYNFDGKLLLPVEDSQLEEILDFILENRGERFFIHCEGGVSRSAGVGIALECILEYDGDRNSLSPKNNPIDAHWRYSPNRLVRDRLIELYNNRKGRKET